VEGLVISCICLMMPWTVQVRLVIDLGSWRFDCVLIWKDGCHSYIISALYTLSVLYILRVQNRSATKIAFCVPCSCTSSTGYEGRGDRDTFQWLSSCIFWTIYVNMARDCCFTFSGFSNRPLWSFFGLKISSIRIATQNADVVHFAVTMDESICFLLSQILLK